MITPDDLAARFAPPLTPGAPYARQQLSFADGAYELAERALDLLPRGHHLDQAVQALETAAHWVTAGLAALAADTPTDVDQAVPYAVAERPTRPVPGGASLGELDLNVSLWRTGIRTSPTLHPIARLVAHTLAEAADQHGYIADGDQPTVTALCDGTGLGTPDVLCALEDLVAGGWVSRHSAGGADRATRYQLRMPEPAPQNGPAR